MEKIKSSNFCKLLIVFLLLEPFSECFYVDKHGIQQPYNLWSQKFFYGPQKLGLDLSIESNNVNDVNFDYNVNNFDFDIFECAETLKKPQDVFDVVKNYKLKAMSIINFAKCFDNFMDMPSETVVGDNMVEYLHDENFVQNLNYIFEKSSSLFKNERLFDVGLNYHTFTKFLTVFVNFVNTKNLSNIQDPTVVQKVKDLKNNIDKGVYNIFLAVIVNSDFNKLKIKKSPTGNFVLANDEEYFKIFENIDQTENANDEFNSIILSLLQNIINNIEANILREFKKYQSFAGKIEKFVEKYKISLKTRLQAKGIGTKKKVVNYLDSKKLELFRNSKNTGQTISFLKNSLNNRHFELLLENVFSIHKQIEELNFDLEYLINNIDNGVIFDSKSFNKMATKNKFQYIFKNKHDLYLSSSVGILQEKFSNTVEILKSEIQSFLDYSLDKKFYIEYNIHYTLLTIQEIVFNTLNTGNVYIINKMVDIIFMLVENDRLFFENNFFVDNIFEAFFDYLKYDNYAKNDRFDNKLFSKLTGFLTKQPTLSSYITERYFGILNFIPGFISVNKTSPRHFENAIFKNQIKNFKNKLLLLTTVPPSLESLQYNAKPLELYIFSINNYLKKSSKMFNTNTSIVKSSELCMAQYSIDCDSDNYYIQNFKTQTLFINNRKEQLPTLKIDFTSDVKNASEFKIFKKLATNFVNFYTQDISPKIDTDNKIIFQKNFLNESKYHVSRRCLEDLRMYISKDYTTSIMFFDQYFSADTSSGIFYHCSPDNSARIFLNMQNVQLGYDYKFLFTHELSHYINTLYIFKNFSLYDNFNLNWALEGYAQYFAIKFLATYPDGQNIVNTHPIGLTIYEKISELSLYTFKDCEHDIDKKFSTMFDDTSVSNVYRFAPLFLYYLDVQNPTYYNLLLNSFRSQEKYLDTIEILKTTSQDFKKFVQENFILDR